jgi:hypothetical protein
MLTATMRQELPSGPTDDIDGEPPRAEHPSAPVPGHLILIPKRRVTAARRAFSLAFSITQRDVVPSTEPDADRKPCAVWLA